MTAAGDVGEGAPVGQGAGLVKPKENEHGTILQSGEQCLPAADTAGAACSMADEVKNGTNQSESGQTVSGNSGGTNGNLGAGISEPVSRQMPQTTASLRNTKKAAFVADENYAKSNASGQMPQMPYTTNATTEDIESTDFSRVDYAKPTGWGKLWRIERNGNYFIYRLRFVDSADTPKEYRRITRKGGRITPQIEAKFNERKGRGRHAESRTDADRFRSRAFDLAKRIRASN